MLPSSILVALAAIAGVLALVPSLISRYDRSQRADFELSTTKMRVLARRAPKRTKASRAQALRATMAKANTEASDAADTAADTPAETDHEVTASTSAADSRAFPRGRATVAGALRPGVPADDSLVRAALIADATDEDHPIPAPAASPVRTPAIARGVAAVRPPAASSASAAATAMDSTAVFSAASRDRSRLATPELSHWWRQRRRRVLTVLGLLVIGQLAGLLAIGPGFLIGLAVSGILLAAYLLQLRNRAVLDQRRHQVTARRRRRAQVVAGRVMAAAGAAPDPDLHRALIDWIGTPRSARRQRPAAAVETLLGHAGYDAVESSDGTWVLRRRLDEPEQYVSPAEPAAASPAAAPLAPAPLAPAPLAPVVPAYAPVRVPTHTGVPAVAAVGYGDLGEELDEPRVVNF